MQDIYSRHDKLRHCGDWFLVLWRDTYKPPMGKLGGVSFLKDSVQARPLLVALIMTGSESIKLSFCTEGSAKG
jgi:hypothetical protein